MFGLKKSAVCFVFPKEGQFLSRREMGASLIEVLVSIVIASIALLALAGVNAAALRYTKMSQYRATATVLAADIGERMRANKAGFLVNGYQYVTDFAGQSAAPLLPVQLCDTAVSSCSETDIATLDLVQWRILVRNQLPEGAVFVQRQIGDPTLIAADVWVVWRDPAVASTDESPASVNECPDGLNKGADASIRCGFFRINL
jgi:type IV pilus assembly protein PilV